MREVREISDAELDEFVRISANAYPGVDLQTPQNRARFRERMAQYVEEEELRLLALFDEGQMRGVMRWYDFTMNLLGASALTGGIGGVAVDLPYKKRGVAADMLRAFLQHYHAAGSCLAALYPFRPDFYRRMGFGYGAPRYNFRFQPASLPETRNDGRVIFLSAADQPALAACYDLYRQRTHGMMARSPLTWQIRFADPVNHFAGLYEEGSLQGYLIFRFEAGAGDHFLSNRIFLRELVYHTPRALRALLGFLRVQADQIEEISYNTFDPLFFHALHDPRDLAGSLLPHEVYHASSTQGVGLMYRVLDVPRFFTTAADHDFGGQTLVLQIDLADSFFPRNAGHTVVSFDAGRAAVTPTAVPDVTLSLDVADFSGLVMGSAAVPLLYDLGLLTLSDERYLAQVARLFAAPPPVCLTSF